MALAISTIDFGSALHRRFFFRRLLTSAAWHLDAGSGRRPRDQVTLFPLFHSFFSLAKMLPNPPQFSSYDDDSVKMRFGLDACPGEVLGDAVEIVTPVEAIGEAGKIALGVFGADMMISAGDRRLRI